jgi:hypothetical protein
MNRLVKTAFAIGVAGTAVQAGTGGDEWKALDSEIRGLATVQKPSNDGMGWSALLRAVYSYSSDEIAVGGDSSMPDLSGFGFNDIDVSFWGSQGPFSWRVSADLDGNSVDDVGGNGVARTLDLEDAYVRFNCGEYFDTQVGNFKPRVSRSNSVDPEHQLFIDRSAIGSSMDHWDQGLGASGIWEQLSWYAAVMNGLGEPDNSSDPSTGGGHIRDHFYLARVEWMLGSGAGDYEGAMGSSDALNATLGVSFINDDTVEVTGNDSETSAWLFDAHGSVSNIGFGGEIAEIGDEYVGWRTGQDFNNIFSGQDSGNADITSLFLEADSRPWNVYVSYLVNPELEVAVRYEDLDNDISGPVNADGEGADNTLLSLGLNWYRAGAAGKWQVQYTRIKADETGAPEGSVLEVGYSVGLSR